MKIWNEILLIDKLRKEHKLTAEEYKILLECQDSNCLSYLQKQAQEEALSRFGNRVFIRGLIEVTNDAAIIAIIAAFGKAIRRSVATD